MPVGDTQIFLHDFSAYDIIHRYRLNLSFASDLNPPPLLHIHTHPHTRPPEATALYILVAPVSKVFSVTSFNL